MAHDHARHRPPFSQLYPENDLLAVIHDPAAAREAVGALKAAGVPDENVDIVDGAWFEAAMQHLAQTRTPLQRFAASFALEENEVVAEYLEEARQGCSILVVHTSSPDEIETVRSILEGFGAHRMHGYGRFAVTHFERL